MPLQDPKIPERVDDLLKSYVREPNHIVLCVIPAVDRLESLLMSSALRIVKEEVRC